MKRKLLSRDRQIRIEQMGLGEEFGRLMNDKTPMTLFAVNLIEQNKDKDLSKLSKKDWKIKITVAREKTKNDMHSILGEKFDKNYFDTVLIPEKQKSDFFRTLVTSSSAPKNLEQMAKKLVLASEQVKIPNNNFKQSMSAQDAEAIANMINNDVLESQAASGEVEEEEEKKEEFVVSSPFEMYSKILIDKYNEKRKELDAKNEQITLGQWKVMVDDSLHDSDTREGLMDILKRQTSLTKITKPTMKKMIYGSKNSGNYERLKGFVPNDLSEINKVLSMIKEDVKDENNSFMSSLSEDDKRQISSYDPVAERERHNQFVKDLEERAERVRKAQEAEQPNVQPDFSQIKLSASPFVNPEPKPSSPPIPPRPSLPPVPPRPTKSDIRKVISTKSTKSKSKSKEFVMKPSSEPEPMSHKQIHHIIANWQRQQYDQSKSRMVSKNVEEQTKKLGEKIFSLKTGINMDDFKSGKIPQSSISRMFENLTGSFQKSMLSKDRVYLGSHRGGLEALMVDRPAVDELDELAKEHDMQFLIASIEPNLSIRRQIIRNADNTFINNVNKLANLKSIDPNVKKDALMAVSAITQKTAADRALELVGINPDIWTTPGVKKMKPDERAKLYQEIEQDLQKLHTDSMKELRPEVLETKEEKEGGSEAEDVGGVSVGKPEKLEELEEPQDYDYADYANYNLDFDEREGLTSVSGVTTISHQNPLGTRKVPMNLEGLLTELQTMNKESTQKKIDKDNLFSLKPVTAERNMRPLLVKGDVNGILNRTMKEKETNMNFYANWKNISPGYGNGNQQAMPDQIGMPFKNSLLKAQVNNQNYKFLNNYDAGMKQWYKKTYKPLMKKHSLIASKYIANKWAVPMIRSNQTHQLPTRNGSLPAGVGRPIQFQRETQNGFDIYTPFQQVYARQTRLFHGDTVDGRRV